jgi:hypothetical protein
MRDSQKMELKRGKKRKQSYLLLFPLGIGLSKILPHPLGHLASSKIAVRNK